jgi:pimeloyl-ACP methyl ester carboxylesterase
LSIQPFTTSDGVPLHVVEEGPEQGATVVLLHGWTQSLHTWDRVAELLPARAGVPLRLVRFDFRGHGRSGRAPGTATIDRCADDLLELLHARARSGPLVLAGHSMGGMTIMALAERHPELFEERVRAVALVATSHGGLERATSGSPTPWAKLAKRALRTTRLTPHDVPSVLLRQGLRRLLFGKHPRAADVSQVTRELKACDAVAYREFLSSLKKHDRGAALAHLATIPAVFFQ